MTFALLDGFLAHTGRRVLARELHLLGAACMFLASKQEEARPIKLQTFVADICKGKFSAEEMLAQEVEILVAIGFRCELPNVFAFSRCVLGILGVGDGAVFAFVENITFLIVKMSLFFRDIVSRFTCFQIAGAALVMALKLAQSVQKKFDAAVYVR